MEMKWVSSFQHPKSLSFYIEKEVWLSQDNREKFDFRLNILGHPNGQTMHYSYPTLENAQLIAELDWGVPVDSWQLTEDVAE